MKTPEHHTESKPGTAPRRPIDSVPGAGIARCDRLASEVRGILRTPLQAKLEVGPGDDPLEREADRVAAILRSGAEAAVSGRTQEERPRAKGAPGERPVVSDDTEQELAAQKGSGQPLPTATRQFFETHLRHDFGAVRIHNGPADAGLAQRLRARAFTTGSDLFFDQGRYAPDSDQGRALLAHELTHVVQQGSGAAPVLQRREDPGPPVAPSGATPRPAGAPAPATGRPSPDGRTRHTITVVDFGQNANLYNWREVLTHIGEIEAQSVDQMVDDVIAEVGDPATDCISRLTLVGHGSPGNVSVGDGTGWTAEGNISRGNFRPSIARLTPYFCDDASVVLYACNVGRGATGMRFIQSLSDFWQVAVAAPTGAVDGFGIMGVWVWGQPGQVLPADTALIADQISRILDETTYGDDEEMIFDLLEAADSLGLLANVQAELVRTGHWAALEENLIDEDEDRYNTLFP